MERSGWYSHQHSRHLITNLPGINGVHAKMWGKPRRSQSHGQVPERELCGHGRSMPDVFVLRSHVDVVVRDSSRKQREPALVTVCQFQVASLVFQNHQEEGWQSKRSVGFSCTLVGSFPYRSDCELVAERKMLCAV